MSTTAYTHKPIDQMESIWRGSYFRARGELGVKAFGLGVMVLPPDFDRIPRHMHTFDEQEEVYLPLKGSGWLDAGDHRVPIDPGTAVRVGPTASRTVISGPEGLTVLIAGGTPGKPYQSFAPLELGAPEPDPTELPGIKAHLEMESSDDFTAVPIEGSGAFRGVLDGITLYPLGGALGVTAFGMAVLDLEDRQGESSYPLHKHDRDEQTEVYVVASGSGWAVVDDERIEASEDEMIAIAPHATRQWFAGPNGLRLIALGAPTGKVYAGNQPTQL